MIFNYDEDVCGMHDCDKIGRSVIGYLSRNRNKVEHFLLFTAFHFYFEFFQFIKLSSLLFALLTCAKTQINHFPEAQDLLSRAHK